MSTEPALLAAIAANPDDDLPRLVYADWLDENDRSLRAEFIRLQIEIAKLELLPRKRSKQLTPLRQREQQILTEYRRYDLMDKPLNGTGVTSVQFRRGFADDITFTAADYITDGAVVASLAPRPERIRVTDAGAEREWRLLYADAAVLDAITDLSFVPERTEPQRLLISVELLRVRSCCQWLKLKSLDMGNCQIGNVGIRALFAPPCFPSLTELNLSFNDLSDAGVAALLSTGIPQRLKRLELDGNLIGNNGAIALAGALGSSTVLENLSLRMIGVDHRGWNALIGALRGRVELL